MIENVSGLLDTVFRDFRERFKSQVEKLGYKASWRLLKVSDFGVPQLRPRVVFVALKSAINQYFTWPEPMLVSPPTVGEALYQMIAERGWRGADHWKTIANEIALPLSAEAESMADRISAQHVRRKRGRAWAWTLSPNPDFIGMPRLTVQMCAVLQGFPKGWIFLGGKTAAFRQVENAFPPPVAAAVGQAIKSAIQASGRIAEAA